MSGKAAVYLRSSKDRSDVSIAAQRRELQGLASERGLAIVAEYSDVVESAKDERRPGFQRLLADLKGRGRAWDHLLLVDTSRLSRRRYMAEVFAHEAAKRGVSILYSKLPQSDPIADMVVVGVMRVFDELHSLMSREKGVAGMAENVRSGWRAGGQAPRGYRLRKVATGAVRDGEPVTKSVLEPNGDAELVARYLRARATGRPRGLVRRELGIAWPATSLIGMEWNALTYAGHTVWNQHNPKAAGAAGYVGGVKRRPREDWIIQRDTHPGLIATEEAEAILAALTTSTRSSGRRRAAGYVLSGLLVTPQGEAWHGNRRGERRLYRARLANGRGRYVGADEIERAVLAQVRRDLRAPSFHRSVVLAARKRYSAAPDEALARTRRDLAALEQRIERTVALASQTSAPGAVLRQVEALEAERAALADVLLAAEQEDASRRILSRVTQESVARLLDELAGDVEDGDPDRVREALRALAERIELDPDTLECRVHYRMGISGRDRVVTPGGRESMPTVSMRGRRIRIAS